LAAAGFGAGLAVFAVGAFPVAGAFVAAALVPALAVGGLGGGGRSVPFAHGGGP
jgi:hypothetical protein